jgi:hypothetical protein
VYVPESSVVTVFIVNSSVTTLVSLEIFLTVCSSTPFLIIFTSEVISLDAIHFMIVVFSAVAVKFSPPLIISREAVQKIA